MADSSGTMPHNSSPGASIYLEINKIYQDPIFIELSRKTSYDPAKRSQLEAFLEREEELRKELDEARIAYSGNCEKIDVLTEEYEKLKKKTEELENHNQIISRKKAELENELTLLMNTKSNTHDEELVKKTKLAYKYVRNITQVRFSYDESDEDNLSGYVFNKATKNISRLSLNLSKLNQDQVDERLMQLMKKTSHPKYADLSSE